VSVDASNNGTADGETTQDICIAGLAAPGAQIAVFFTTFSQQGWVDLISRVAHPNPGDPVCSVMSSSFYVSNGDDATTLANEGISQSWITAVTAALQDAAIQNVTVCIASGDTGTNSKVGDGKAHVQYPASDPWVLSVGGTTVGNISGTSFDEYVWNDPAPSDPSHWGTTGGGVSDQFPLPQYQADANVPPSLNDGQVRRGVPDVAANASLNSGYSGLYVGGSPFIGNGTSGSSPLWAGLIAVINAAIGHSVGFVNPALYTIGSSAFRSIYGPPGPTDNSNGGVAGYPATQPGWNACTGWGSPKGNALCQSLMSYHFHGSNFSKAQRFALNQAPNRAAASACTVASGCDLGSLPEEIRSRLNNASVKQFAGVVDSIVAQPPYLAVGIYNQQQSKIQGFVIPDTTVEAQQCAIKAIFTAYEAKSSVNVYYQDPGGVLYAIVISAT
jgi:kumamolisin